jgi:copper chaperone CopZ
VKQLAWVESASAEGANLTVVSKSGQSADVVSLLTTLRKAGFPAMELIVTGPLTITMPHLCCPSCTNDLKAKLEGLRSMALDKENIKIDQAARTVTLQPRAGGRLNLVQVLTQLERAGWSAEKITIAAQTASTNDASRNAN